MQHGTGPLRAGRGQRAPAEQRMDVVGVDDVRTQAAHGAPDLVGFSPPVVSDRAAGGPR